MSFSHGHFISPQSIFKRRIARQVKDAEVSCVVRWLMCSQPHVKLALQHHFTLSFHEMRACVARTESFLPLGLRCHIYTSCSLFFYPRSCGQWSEPGAAVCALISECVTFHSRLYSKATCFALLICVPTPGVCNGLSQTDMSRLLPGVDAVRKTRAILVLCVCHFGPAIERQGT